MVRTSLTCVNRIRAVLTHLRDLWRIRPVVTLSDKDWSEINACITVFPNIKHQLCFWHCIRALKKRLPIKDRAPAFYDVEAAMREFGWIDKTFVPLAQAGEVRRIILLIELHSHILFRILRPIFSPPQRKLQG